MKPANKDNRKLVLALFAVLALNSGVLNLFDNTETNHMSSYSVLGQSSNCKALGGAAIKKSYQTRAHSGETTKEIQFNVTMVGKECIGVKGLFDTEETSEHVAEVRLEAADCNTGHCSQSVQIKKSAIDDTAGGIDAILEKLIKEKAQAIADAAEKQRKDDEERKLEKELREKFQARVDRCEIKDDWSKYRDSKGKKVTYLKGQEKLECKIEGLANLDLDEEEMDKKIQREILPEIKRLMSGNTADRQAAGDLLSLLSDETLLGPGAKGQIAAMKDYQYWDNRLNPMYQRMANARTPEEKLFAQSQLIATGNQALAYMTSKTQQYSVASQMNPANSDGANEYSYWQNALGQSIQLAMSNPKGALDRRDVNGKPLIENIDFATRAIRSVTQAPTDLQLSLPQFHGEANWATPGLNRSR